MASRCRGRCSVPSEARRALRACPPRLTTGVNERALSLTITAWARIYNSNNFCSNDSPPKLTAANGYGAWSVGLDLRVTLF